MKRGIRVEQIIEEYGIGIIMLIIGGSALAFFSKLLTVLAGI